jgi:ABC1 atypical kinase-like domain
MRGRRTRLVGGAAAAVVAGALALDAGAPAQLPPAFAGGRVEQIRRARAAFSAAALAGVDYKLTYSRMSRAPFTFRGHFWPSLNRAWRAASASASAEGDAERPLAGIGARWRAAAAAATTLDEEAEAEITHRLHKRNAERALKLCKRNAGTYTKGGQAIANMAYGLPPEYSIFRQLHDEAPSMPLTSVEAVFHESFGAGVGPHELFDEFDPQPVGAASLAQVHRARRRDTGELVAVKVQFLGLEHRVEGDMHTIESIFNTMQRFFPDFFGSKLAWVVDEVSVSLLFYASVFSLPLSTSSNLFVCFVVPEKYGPGVRLCF